jgi:hypothetical protein
VIGEITEHYARARPVFDDLAAELLRLIFRVPCMNDTPYPAHASSTTMPLPIRWSPPVTSAMRAGECCRLGMATTSHDVRGLYAANGVDQRGYHNASSYASEYSVSLRSRRS